MTFASNVIYGALAGAGAFLVYKKRHTVAWHLTSCYSNLTFYIKKKQENTITLLTVRNAHTLIPLYIPLQDGYEEHIEVQYNWNNKTTRF